MDCTDPSSVGVQHEPHMGQRILETSCPLIASLTKRGGVQTRAAFAKLSFVNTNFVNTNSVKLELSSGRFESKVKGQTGQTRGSALPEQTRHQHHAGPASGTQADPPHGGNPQQRGDGRQADGHLKQGHAQRKALMLLE